MVVSSCIGSFCRFIETSLEEWTNTKQAELISAGIVRLEFRPFLKWLDRNLETIVTGALRQVSIFF